MNGALRKKIINSLMMSVGAGILFVILLLHNAWGDDRYQLREEAIRSEIARLDTELTVIDQEILFADNEREKQKFQAIKSIYQREKEALREKLQDDS